MFHVTLVWSLITLSGHIIRAYGMIKEVGRTAKLVAWHFLSMFCEPSPTALGQTTIAAVQTKHFIPLEALAGRHKAFAFLPGP